MCNSRGEKQFVNITSVGVMIVNVECALTFVELGRSEVIDLIVCISNLLLRANSLYYKDVILEKQIVMVSMVI